LISSFTSDYERLNPITKREAKIRKYQLLFTASQDDDERELYREKLERFKNGSISLTKALQDTLEMA